MIPVKILDDYQEVARDYLLEEPFRCLFDEPGVGKTAPSIMAGNTLTANGPVLITCPAYVIKNWEREIHDFLPGAVVVRADGSGYESRHQALSSYEADFVLTSYNNWGAKVTDKKSPDFGKYLYGDVLVDKLWGAYIFDEGHRLRGRNSNWTKHVFKLRLSQARNRETPILILTGTPFVRDGGDFWPYFHLYDKKTYGSYWKFVKERCVVTETPWSTNVGNISPSYTNRFREELAAFSLRRTVSEIPQLADLEFVDHDYVVDMPTSVVAMIKKAKKNYVLEHEDLARPEFLKGSGPLYVRQRQIATVPPTKQNPKLEWLKDFLTDKKGKVVVWTWYKDSARAVADALGSQAVLITGEVTSSKRDDRLAEWRTGDSKNVLVATIPSLNTGISLTEAYDTVFLEHSELPADNEQALKRLCRRGQGKVVQVHHVWAAKTVDAAIRLTLENRDIGIQEALQKWVREDEPEEAWFT